MKANNCCVKFIYAIDMFRTLSRLELHFFFVVTIVANLFRLLLLEFDISQFYKQFNQCAFNMSKVFYVMLFYR